MSFLRQRFLVAKTENIGLLLIKLYYPIFWFYSIFLRNETRYILKTFFINLKKKIDVKKGPLVLFCQLKITIIHKKVFH